MQNSCKQKMVDMNLYKFNAYMVSISKMEGKLPVNFRIVIVFGEEEKQAEDLEGELWVCRSTLSLYPEMKYMEYCDYLWKIGCGYLAILHLILSTSLCA